MTHAHEPEGPTLYGMIAEFDTSKSLLKAAKKAYKAGYRDLDAYSPFPIHGLNDAIGFKKNRVAPIMLTCGLLGASTGFGVQCLSMAWHYPYMVGGRPPVSWPSFIPVTYECGILSAGIAGTLAMILLNGLPRLHHPIFSAKNFENATNDAFFLCIEAKDKQFDQTGTRSFLESLGAKEVSEVVD
jgi:hypothetical protein